jgi:hypothetical protein
MLQLTALATDWFAVVFWVLGLLSHAKACVGDNVQAATNSAVKLMTEVTIAFEICYTASDRRYIQSASQPADSRAQAAACREQAAALRNQAFGIEAKFAEIEFQAIVFGAALNAQYDELESRLSRKTYITVPQAGLVVFGERLKAINARLEEFKAHIQRFEINMLDG